MNHFYRNIKPYVNAELRASRDAAMRGAQAVAYQHLERAHVLGQEATLSHTLVHWQMLLWGMRQRSIVEVIGQSMRIVGAVTKTVFGLVPQGNTGGTNVSPFQAMPIASDVAQIIAAAKQRS